MYFGEMVSRHIRLMQSVQGLSLGFSSAAVFTVIREPWPEVAATLAAVVAIANV
ncbi:MAG: hypothetical protein OXB91_05390 [Bryobacterales bacterium]|nr:hypothetical protein [Bryobacterales bacterium]